MYSLKLIVTKKLEITFLCNYYLILKKLQNELQTVHVYLLVKELQTVHVYRLVRTVDCKTSMRAKYSRNSQYLDGMIEFNFVP
jgi:hypothetical protein